MFLLVAALSACESGGPSDLYTGGPDSAPAESAKPAKPEVLEWGTPATVDGKAENPVKVTPVGILYTRGDGNQVKPTQKWLVAVSLRLEAEQQPDYLAPPIDGGGFYWRADGDEELIAKGNGNALNAPWVGRAPSLLARNLQPGEPEIAVIDFDLPTAGGTLLFKTPAGDTTRWKLPARTTGTGLTQVRAALKEFGIKP
ncbi:hypothetical protein [Streptosporangium sp. NPDC051022]|uniref:hypothetical protein n=1 Tax=Streptosporangium sp. NPDC051022 TaxID=3155752 RepID=UPI003418442C